MPKTSRPGPANRLRALGVLLALLPASLAAQQQPRPLTLEEAIGLALDRSRELELLHLEEQESKAKKDIARANYLPSIKNESGLLHVTELAGVKIPAGAFGNSPSTGLIPSETLFLGQGASTTYTSGTGLAQPLTQLLRIRESNRAAEADLRISGVKSYDGRNQVALQVRQLFYSILIAQATRDAAQRNLAASQTKSAETTQDVADGKALEVSALEAQATLLDAGNALLTQQIQIRNLTMNLDDLMGLPVETPLNLAEPAALPVAVPTREEAVAQAALSNAKILTAELTVQKARAGYAAAREKYIPDITAIARYSYQSGVPFLVHNFGTFGLSFTYDVFDGGKRTSEIEEARIQLRQAEVNLDRLRESVRIQVESAYNQVEQMESLVAVARKGYDTRKELARVTGEQALRSAALPSARDQALARADQAHASLYQAELGLSLAQANILTLLGRMAK